jgi:polysaccharide chain length determinant protein (PEP-CTERM system associated)
MEETYEEQKSEGLDVERYLEIVRRRHIHFLIPLFLGWLVVWGASWILPVRYKSATLILVEQPTMPSNYVLPNVVDDLQNRLQSISQQILSRTRLLLIIDKLNLYSNSRRQITPDEKVELMRKDIGIELVHGTQANQISAFRINYLAGDPHVAQRVTGELTNLFISENLKVRQQQSEDTTKFIGSQLEIARANLAEQEAKVREFKGQHEGELPSQEASNLQILSGLQAQLQNEQDTLNAAKQQRVYLQTLIEQYRTVHTSRSADGTPMGLAGIDQELDKLKARLAEMSSRYTEHYPEVESLKDEIAKAEKRRATLVTELKAKGSSAKQFADGSATSDTADPSQNAASLQMQGQLRANEAEIANREQSIAGLKARVNNYQDRLNSSPTREQELADLTRGYDQSKANYDDLLKKQNSSEMATNMEQMQQGERFTMLDPPSLSLKPDFPNRLKFCAMGLGVGLALGLLVVVSLEIMDDRLHSEREIKTLLSMVVLSDIPEIVRPSDERDNKKRRILGWAMAALVVATILAGSAISYLRG